jgi:hypothetical protein
MTWRVVRSLGTSRMRRAGLGLGIWVLMALAGITPAAACSIDGIASLQLNNLYATKNQTAAANANLATWAPFSLGDASPHALLHFSEDLNKLRNVLPKGSLQHPFTWRFGDGASVVGQDVAHKYTDAGLYKLEVRYYLPSTRQWVLFDSAQLHVVPPTVVSLAPLHASGASMGGTKTLELSLAGLAGVICLGVIVWQLRGMRPTDKGNVTGA